MNGKEIADKKKISTASVSKTLKNVNSRIEELLKSAASSNKIKLDILSSKQGYARGYSPPLKIRVYITYSPANGIQLWYDHKGSCEMCEVLNGCRDLLIKEFKEREIEIPHKAIRPSDLSALLFSKIEGRLE